MQHVYGVWSGAPNAYKRDGNRDSRLTNNECIGRLFLLVSVSLQPCSYAIAGLMGIIALSTNRATSRRGPLPGVTGQRAASISADKHLPTPRFTIPLLCISSAWASTAAREKIRRENAENETSVQCWDSGCSQAAVRVC